MLLSIDEYNALGFEGGEDAETCEKALARAERMVDLLTDGKCSAENTPEKALNDLKQAIAAQAEMYLLYGAQPAAGKTVIGDFSYTAEGDGISAVSPLTMTILKLAGLYYRCVSGR
ncbi:MAG: hypothetical protein J1F60_07065 [Oscillospiraceae bacterium]|nr:hypothetical protein [Oscillospiraceae bacterium]